MRDAVAGEVHERDRTVAREAPGLEGGHGGHVNGRNEEAGQRALVRGDEGITEGADGALEVLGYGPASLRPLEKDEFPRVVRDGSGRAGRQADDRRQSLSGHPARGLEQALELALPGARAGLNLGRNCEMANDWLAGHDVAALALDAAGEDAAGRRAVHGVRPGRMLLLDAQETGLCP